MATIEPTENGSTKAPEPESNLITEAITAILFREVPDAGTITPATEAQTGNENQNAGSGLAQLTSEHKSPLAATKNTASMVDNKWPGWPGDCVFGLIVPVAKVGSIIGRKGELIKKMSEESRARIRVLDGAAGTSDRIVLISGKEEPEATLSPAMDAAVRVFKRVSGLSENEGEAKSASVGVAFCSIWLLVASSQAINLIGKQGSLIKSIQENTGASMRVLSGDEVPFYAASDERIVELQGEASKVLKALQAVIGHLRKFLVGHSVLPLFEKTYNATVTQERQVDTWTDNSVLQNAPQTAVSSIYSLSSKREPLFLDRESQLEQQLPSSGISLYGQDHSHTGIRSSGISRAGAPIVTQMESPKEALAFMDLAIKQAKLALDSLEVPVGCVIVQDGNVIASGRNRTNGTRNATRHAEMEAIDALLGRWQKEELSKLEIAEKFTNCYLYVTCEPCIMCATALSILGIKEVFYGCTNDKFGGCGSILSMHSSNSNPYMSGGVPQGKGFKCSGGIMATEAISLFQSFYEQGNPNAPKPHRPVIQ